MFRPLNKKICIITVREKYLCKRNINILLKSAQDNLGIDNKKLHDGTYYHEKLLVGYSREQMCDLVYDVKRYKEFVPFCINSKILVDIPKGELNLSKLGRNNLNLNLRNFDTKEKQQHLPTHTRAQLEIGYPPIYESYVSNVSMNRPNLVKAISRDTKLFEYLVNEWKFHPNPQSFEIDYLNSLSESELKELEKSCLIEFTVAFKFSNLVYSAFSKVFMDQIFKKMVGAFMDRAKILYGEPSVVPKVLKSVERTKQ